MIQHLPWDSDFFHLKIGKSTTTQLTVQGCLQLINEKIQHGYNLIYLFCDDAEREADEAIHRQGGLLADLKVTYQKEVPTIGKPQSPNISAYTGPLKDELHSLALASGHQSRLKKGQTSVGPLRRTVHPVDPKIARWHHGRYRVGAYCG